MTFERMSFFLEAIYFVSSLRSWLALRFKLTCRLVFFLGKKAYFRLVENTRF